MYQPKNTRDEWKIRYDIALDIAKQEYLLQIERIKNLDEKIEKFLIVAAAFIAALVSILGGFNTMLSIHQKSESWIHFINGAITLLIIYSLYLSFYTFKNFLKGLKLTETRRMPNTIDLIHDPKEASLEWTYEVIKFYEDARASRSLHHLTNRVRGLRHTPYQRHNAFILCVGCVAQPRTRSSGGFKPPASNLLSTPPTVPHLLSNGGFIHQTMNFAYKKTQAV